MTPHQQQQNDWFARSFANHIQHFKDWIDRNFKKINDEFRETDTDIETIYKNLAAIVAAINEIKPGAIKTFKTIDGQRYEIENPTADAPKLVPTTPAPKPAKGKDYGDFNDSDRESFMSDCIDSGLDGETCSLLWEEGQDDGGDYGDDHGDY